MMTTMCLILSLMSVEPAAAGAGCADVAFVGVGAGAVVDVGVTVFVAVGWGTCFAAVLLTDGTGVLVGAGLAAARAFLAALGAACCAASVAVGATCCTDGVVVGGTAGAPHDATMANAIADRTSA
jgi:hypothetical protein